MGDMVEFAVNGTPGQGYLAVSATGSGPGVVVIQEWWGLVPHIKDVVERCAAAGFTALAPDLFGGTTTTEPDEAGKLMMSLNLDRAGKELAGAVDFLLAQDSVTSDRVGVVGFCMGGGLALLSATQLPGKVGACAPFYGVIPWEAVEPDWSALGCPVRGHFAELDGFVGPDKVADLERRLTALGKDVALEVHPGVDHAFFNDARPEVFSAEASQRAWDATVTFLHDTLD
ncbi:MAG: dienelactone hydrolase family protein [Actinomycetes bacterium]